MFEYELIVVDSLESQQDLDDNFDFTVVNAWGVKEENTNPFNIPYEFLDLSENKKD